MAPQRGQRRSSVNSESSGATEWICRPHDQHASLGTGRQADRRLVRPWARRIPVTSRRRPVAAAPSSASGSTITTPLPPLPRSPFDPHGRVVEPSPLLWPGGPPPAVGHGGIGFLALTPIGVAVGTGVGRAVGFAVGFGVGGVGGVAVGREVGRGVGVECGVVDGAGVLTTAGVGVGPWATVGALSVGLADGSPDGTGLADAGGVDSEAPGVGDALAPDVAGLADGLAPAGSEELPGAPALGCEDGPTAIPPFGWAGAIRPAVSATVARIKLRSPIATTRRARWAEVTTTDGLLPTGPLAEVPRVPADGSTGTPGPAHDRRLDGPRRRLRSGPDRAQPKAAAARSTYRARPDPVMLS